jgi:pentatricopeptide repeat protein
MDVTAKCLPLFRFSDKSKSRAQAITIQSKMTGLFRGFDAEIHDTNEDNLTTNDNNKQFRFLNRDAYGNIISGIVSMNGDIITLCKQGRSKDALHILQTMDNHGIWADYSAYSCLLHSCITNKTLPEGKLVHAHIIQTGFQCTEISFGNKLVAVYAKCGSLVDAHRILNQMPERQVVSWTTMIAAYARHGNCEEALELFYQMKQKGIQPNEFTFSSVLPACGSLAALQHGKEIHEEIIRSGFQYDVFVASALVDMYVKCHSIEDARQVFDKMPERNVVTWTAMVAGYMQNGFVDEAMELFQQMPERNVVSWTSMIAGYIQIGCLDKALKLFQEMPERNVVSWTVMIAGYVKNGLIDEAWKAFQEMPEPNVVSWNVMIAGFVQNEFFEEALLLFEEMPVRDVASWTTLIAGFAQSGNVERALELFWEMPARNLVSWNAIIAGCVQNGQVYEALNIFQQLRLTDAELDSHTFASVLPACASLAALEQGKEIHEEIIRSGLQSYVTVENSLLDMYAKCGSIEDAWKVFDRMKKRDIVSWNAMLVGYAIHGCGKEAIHLFEQMKHSGIGPDHVTFIGVLSATCHAGLVDDGRQYFHSMVGDYHITPVMEHYCCMVDLLGRSGSLDEAQDFINKMPVKPDAAVWGSLLGACRIHSHVRLGEYVAEHLFELNPKNAAPYVSLSNIYAAVGRQDDTEKVRKMMKDRKVKNDVGCSWIEVNKYAYAFLVEDRSHPQTKEIYLKLMALSGQMKEAGYVPETKFVVHDVEEEQKEHILCYHSEKLAIAFGLINTCLGLLSE